jgi:hypothetical protein
MEHSPMLAAALENVRVGQAEVDARRAAINPALK